MPASLGRTVADWTRHWQDVLRGLADKAVHYWDGLKSDLGKLARAMRNELHASLGDIAAALWGLKKDLKAVAKTLWDMGGNTRTAVLGALASGIGGKYADMASAILSIQGTSLSNVAYALKNGISGVSLNSVARALWDMGGNTRTAVLGALASGIGGSYAVLASAVYYGIGGANLAELASILKNGANINAASVARALWDMGGNTRANIVWALVNGISVREWDAWGIVNSL